MESEKKPEEVKGKKYYLTVEEKTNINARRALMQEYDYLTHLVRQDIANYIHSTVYTRIGIDPNRNNTLSDDNTFITLSEEVS